MARIGDMVIHKITGQEMVITDKITTESGIESYRCKWFNNQDGKYWKDEFSPCEFLPIQVTKSFQNDPKSIVGG